MSKPANTKNIAVIGGGGAGVTAAWLLNKQYNVRLFEAESHLGGHAYSHRLNLQEGEAHVDMGVEYFNEKLSPNLSALLQLLGIDTFIAPLTFRAFFEGSEDSWSNISIEGKLRDQLHEEFERFHAEMTNIMQAPGERHKNMSIGEYLDENDYSNEFRYQALYPMMTIYLGCNAPAYDYNLMYVVYSFHMNLLSLFSAGYWRKAKGGIYNYIQLIAQELEGCITLNCNVKQVNPVQDGVEVIYNDDQKEYFDQVVFATHADITLSILSGTDPLYQEVLGKFEYAPVSSYMHTDKQVVQVPESNEYFEFTMPESFDIKSNTEQSGSLTRVYNNLFQYKKFKDPLLVTFDPQRTIDPAKIEAERHWKLPKLRPQDFMRRQQIQQIQGKNNLWFCGTDTSFTGHEGAVVSALIIAEQLGVDYIFADNPAASTHYHTIKDFMGFK